MATDLPIMLAELRQDHRNMSLLLRLLDRESNRVYAGENADFELMYDVMLYMTVYPDVVHHPKEDQLYAELKAARPELSAGMSKIAADHRLIAEQGLSVREMIAAVISGDMVERNTVVRDTLRYVDTLRRHMQWEEGDLFRRLDRMISDGHKVADQAQIVCGVDPVFGNSVEEKFVKLFERIRVADSP